MNLIKPSAGRWWGRTRADIAGRVQVYQLQLLQANDATVVATVTSALRDKSGDGILQWRPFGRDILGDAPGEESGPVTLSRVQVRYHVGHLEARRPRQKRVEKHRAMSGPFD